MDAPTIDSQAQPDHSGRPVDPDQDQSVQPPAPPESPRDLILQAAGALFSPGQVAELRILGVGGKDKVTASGWFNDYDKLADAAIQYDTHRKPAGIYVTLNPVHDACLARANNHAVDYAKPTTSDRDILRRYWLPIDIDPVRPAGVSSADPELGAARDLARDVANWLEQSLGWPRMLRGFSGNGIHLLPRINLPNTKEAQDLISDALKALDLRFSTAENKIDIANHNASRIWKLYGTMARKGEPLDTRPHRRSRLFTLDGILPTFRDLEIVTEDQLRELISIGKQIAARSAVFVPKKSIPTDAEEYWNNAPGPGDFAVDLDAFVERTGIPIAKREAFDRTGVRYTLEHCIFNSGHIGTSVVIGRNPRGSLFYKCQHDSCATKQWRDVRDHFKAMGIGLEGARGTQSTGPAGQPTPAFSTSPATSSDVPGPSGGGDRSAATTAGEGTDVVTGPAGPAGSVKPSRRKKGDPDPWSLAKALIDEEMTDSDTGQVTYRRHRETFYSYDRARRCYRSVPNDSIRVQVTRFLGDRIEEVTARKVSDVIQSAAALLTTPHEIDLPCISKVNPETRCCSSDPTRRNRITLRNGILDLDQILAGRSIAESILPHTPEWFSTNALPFDCPITDEQSLCPEWDAFLEDIFSDPETGIPDCERIGLLQEAFGFCFLPKSRIEAFFIFTGIGRNGKSTTFNILTSILGIENICSLSMEHLTDPTFSVELDGKMANICADLSELHRVEEGMLKKIVSGDLVTGRRLYRSPLQFRNRARLFFAANNLPRFTDTTIGLWRRMKVIPFDRNVTEEEQDVRLEDRLREELPGIFWWALKGMIRLDAQSRFTRSSKCEIAIRNYQATCFPILLFLDECTDEDGAITAGDLYNYYKIWSERAGLSKRKSIHSFVSDVVGFRQKIEYNRVRGGMESKMLLNGISMNRIAESELSRPVTHLIGRTDVFFTGNDGVTQ